MSCWWYSQQERLGSSSLPNRKHPEFASPSSEGLARRSGAGVGIRVRGFPFSAPLVRLCPPEIAEGPVAGPRSAAGLNRYFVCRRALPAHTSQIIGPTNEAII